MPLSVAVWGIDKSGKTHFGLTGEPPIHAFDFNNGLYGALPKFRGKLITSYSYKTFMHSDLVGEQRHVSTYAAFLKDLKALPSVTQGTVIYDTSTELWKLVSAAQIEGSKSHDPYHRDEYGEANGIMRSLIAYPQSKGYDVILTAFSAKEYVGDTFTGKREMKSWGDLAAYVDVVLHMERRNEKDPKEVINKATIDSFRFSVLCHGMEIANPDYAALIKIVDIVKG